MTETPKNQTLSSKVSSTAKPSATPEPEAAASYPRMLVHRDSKPGALITKEVKSAEEAAELGDEWTTVDQLKFETAPSVNPAPPKEPKEPPAKD